MLPAVFPSFAAATASAAARGSSLATSIIHRRAMVRSTVYAVVFLATHRARNIRYSSGIIFVEAVRRCSRSQRACLSRGKPGAFSLSLR